MVRNSDKKLLDILLQNSRTPYLQIAKALGVSEATIRKKVKRLMRNGVIKKFTIEIDPRKVGYEVTTMIGLDTKPEAFLSVLGELKNFKEVVSLYSSSGDHMIMMECWFKDSNELTLFIRKLQRMNGVTRVCPAIILEKIK